MILLFKPLIKLKMHLNNKLRSNNYRKFEKIPNNKVCLKVAAPLAGELCIYGDFLTFLGTRQNKDAVNKLRTGEQVTGGRWPGIDDRG